MTDYNITVGKELLPELLSGQDGLAKLIESVLNQVLEAQVTDSLGTERYELLNVNYDCRLTTINFAGALPHEKLNY